MPATPPPPLHQRPPCISAAPLPFPLHQVQLEAILGSFDRFCLYPSKFNKCFDWDIDGTRWSRVGFTTAQAYTELGLRSYASSGEVGKTLSEPTPPYP